MFCDQCCRVLKCVAVHYNVLQRFVLSACVFARKSPVFSVCDSEYGSLLQCVAACCSVLQCVALCCIVFQCVAGCTKCLQNVAGCCSVLRCAVCEARVSLLGRVLHSHKGVPHSFKRVCHSAQRVALCCNTHESDTRKLAITRTQ